MPVDFKKNIIPDFSKAIESFTNLPYTIDKYTVGKGANLLAEGMSRCVSAVCATSIKNGDFSGRLREIFLRFAGTLGSQETKNLQQLKSKVWLTKPFEFFRSSYILTARKLYDATAGNFHAEMEVETLSQQISNLALELNYSRDGNPEEIFKGQIQKLIQKKLDPEHTLSRSDFAQKVRDIALPEFFEQGIRIFVVTTFWSSYVGNEAPIATLLSVSALSGAVGLFGNSGAITQTLVHGVGAVMNLYLFDSSHWLATAASIGGLAVWTGLIANGKTKELMKYTPPEKANEIQKCVMESKEELHGVVRATLQYSGDFKKFDQELANIKPSAYPFSRISKKSVRFAKQEREEVANEEKKENPKLKAAKDKATREVEQYKRRHPNDFNNKQDYWRLVKAQNIANFNYWKGLEDFRKCTICICNIERARIQEATFEDVATFKNVRKIIIEKYIPNQMKKEEFKEKENQDRLKKLIEEIKKVEHPEAV